MNMQYGSPIGDINSGDQSFGARRPYLVDGDFNLEVERCVRRGRSGDDSFLIEATILESNAPERPAGMQVVIFIDLTNADTRGKHLCAFIASMQGIDPLTLPKNTNVTPWDNQPWAGYVMWAMSEQNPYGKRKFFCNVQTIFKKDKGPADGARGKFTLHSFSPFGLKQVGPRILGPAFSTPDEPQQQAAPQNGFPGAAPGFQMPAPQPGAAPQGFGTPGVFAPPGAPQQPQAAPPAGWGPQPSPPPQGYPQQAPMPPQGQPGFQQQPMPQQPQPQPNPGYSPQFQPQGVPQPQPQFQPQPGGPQFGGPWGGGQR